jgi:GNAT superfamily N-acetyltransferase
MEYYADLQFRHFEATDVELFTNIMKRAFDEDTRIHLGNESGGPPGYDNGDFLRRWALHPDSTAYAIFKDGAPIGVVIVWIRDNHENFLGNIFVDPDLQNKGLGLLIWRFIEQKYPETRVWRTDTPGFSKRNHNFYVNKCGFKIVRIEHPGDQEKESYLLEKEMPRSAAR